MIVKNSEMYSSYPADEDAGQVLDQLGDAGLRPDHRTGREKS